MRKPDLAILYVDANTGVTYFDLAWRDASGVSGLYIMLSISTSSGNARTYRYTCMWRGAEEPCGSFEESEIVPPTSPRVPLTPKELRQLVSVYA